MRNIQLIKDPQPDGHSITTPAMAVRWSRVSRFSYLVSYLTSATACIITVSTRIMNWFGSAQKRRVDQALEMTNLSTGGRS